mmetsp:Transcript_19514/g.40854  ORF Transcript_19514/g.40854 Transcript_19514/m.40854 type:complete len:302 (+) Transcript_19514:1452-2357(+)
MTKKSIFDFVNGGNCGIPCGIVCVESVNSDSSTNSRCNGFFFKPESSGNGDSSGISRQRDILSKIFVGYAVDVINGRELPATRGFVKEAAISGISIGRTCTSDQIDSIFRNGNRGSEIIPSRSVKHIFIPIDPRLFIHKHPSGIISAGYQRRTSHNHEIVMHTQTVPKISLSHGKRSKSLPVPALHRLIPHLDKPLSIARIHPRCPNGSSIGRETYSLAKIGIGFRDIEHFDPSIPTLFHLKDINIHTLDGAHSLSIGTQTDVAAPVADYPSRLPGGPHVTVYEYFLTGPGSDGEDCAICG